MKIIYIVHCFFPDHFSGTEKAVLNQARVQQKQGNLVKVITYRLEGKVLLDPLVDKILIDNYVYEGVEVITFKHVRECGTEESLFQEDEFYIVAKEILMKEKPDIIHVWHPMRLESFVLAAQDLDIPYIVTLSDYYLICPKINLINTSGQLCLGADGGEECLRACHFTDIERLKAREHKAWSILNLAKAVFSPSHSLTTIFKKQFPNLNVGVINIGLDLAFLQQNRKQYNYKSTINFFFCGVLLPHKGPHVIIDAFQKLNTKGASLRLFGLCFTEYADSLIQQTVNRPDIQFFGKYQKEETSEIMNKNDVLVLPSICYETYSLVLHEALACNVPVICSNVGAMAEKIRDGETGFTFPVGDSDALAMLMQRIIDDPTIINKIKQKIELVSIPTIEQEACQYASIYKQIVESCDVSKIDKMPVDHVNEPIESNFLTDNMVQISTQIDIKSLGMRIFTVPTTMYVALWLQAALQSYGFKADIVNNITSDEESYLYYVICPQVLEKLPKHSVAFQMEQSISTRWFSENYFSQLNKSLCVFDYSLKNIDFLSEKGFKYRQLYYMPLGYLPGLSDLNAVESVYEYDVVFYGDTTSPRRKRILDELAKKFKVKTICGIYGTDLYRELLAAPLVINIHYYENALLETTRLYECLSLNKLVISEVGIDQEDHPELSSCIDFVDFFDISAMIQRIEYWLTNESARKEKIEHNRDQVMNRQNIFFYLGRFLLNYEFIGFDSFYKQSRSCFNYKSNFAVLGLPENHNRRAYIKELINTYFTDYNVDCFYGVRHEKAVRGCGMSYKWLIKKAQEQNLDKVVIFEDDIGLRADTMERLKVILEYANNPLYVKEWDIINCFMAEFTDEYPINKIFEYKGVRFIETTKMVSNVFDIYNRSVYNRIINWDETNDEDNNIIDQYLKRSFLKVLLVVPFLVDHKDNLQSTLWTDAASDPLSNSQLQGITDSAVAYINDKISALCIGEPCQDGDITILYQNDAREQSIAQVEENKQKTVVDFSLKMELNNLFSRVLLNIDNKEDTLVNYLDYEKFATLKKINKLSYLLKIVSGDLDVVSMPAYVNFQTSGVCNLRCPHCEFHGEKAIFLNDHSNDLPFENVVTLAKEALPFANNFSLTQTGEPLVDPRLKEYLAEFERFGSKLFLISNGTMLNKERIIDVLPLMEVIHISIDGASQETCERLRCGSNFRILINNLRLLTLAARKLNLYDKIEFAFQTTIMASNLHELPRFIELAHILDFKTVIFQEVVIFNEKHNIERVGFHKDKYDQYMVQAMELGKKYNIQIHCPNVEDLNRSSIIVTGSNYFIEPSILKAQHFEFIELLNQAKLEADLVAVVEKSQTSTVLAAHINSQVQHDIDLYLKTLLSRLGGEIEKYTKNNGSDSCAYCHDLGNALYTYPSSIYRTCCTAYLADKPRSVIDQTNVGTLSEGSVMRNYNGISFSNFLRNFYSNNSDLVPEPCKGCFCRGHMRLDQLVEMILNS